MTSRRTYRRARIPVIGTVEAGRINDPDSPFTESELVDLIATHESRLVWLREDLARIRNPKEAN